MKQLFCLQFVTAAGLVLLLVVLADNLGGQDAHSTVYRFMAQPQNCLLDGIRAST